VRPDSRLDQIRQEISAAAACLDDARTLVADIGEGPPLGALDAEDFRIVRMFTNQALFKSRNAFAALSRLQDRARREAILAGTLRRVSE
jgi:hypothetical protein